MVLARVVYGLFVFAVLLFSQSAFAISYKYDALGRLVEVVYDSGRKVIYDYDPAGNRTEHAVDFSSEYLINDSIPTLGIGNNLIDLSGWPVGEAPAGGTTVANWANSSSFYNEARWARVTGPGDSQLVTTMEVGQTEADQNGGGTSHTNYITIDKTKAYEYSIYFRKHDLTVQNLYFGLTQGGRVKQISNSAIYTNPYFFAWNTSTQAAYLDPAKWYKIVGYVMPIGYPEEATSLKGGVFDVATGLKVANVTNFRWDEDHSSPLADARFFTYYSESVQNRYTTYFYQPEVRVTNISYTPVAPVISASHANAVEGSNATYTVNLSVATTVDVKVDYTVTDNGGSGSAGSSDYTATSGTLVIPTGQSQGTISVATNTDSILEANEAIKLTLSSPVRATIAAGETTEVAYITDDGLGGGVNFSVNDVSATEGSNHVFTITKSGSTALSHNVTYQTASGSAGTADYTAIAATTVTFAPGDTFKTVTVSGVNDSIYESNEVFYLNLTNPTAGAQVNDSQGMATINNNDTAPNFSINNVSTSEGNNHAFVITKSGSTALNHNVSYTTTSGTAGTGDYTTKSGTVTFSAGTSTQSVTVVGKEDSIYENSEVFYVDLSSATSGATISDSRGNGTITNDDVAPSFSINNVSASEGNNHTFVITKSGSTALNHNVSYTTTSGTAGTGDYTTKSGTVTFSAGTSTQSVTVVGKEDSIYENSEVFYVDLSSATSGATISDSRGNGTITNDDAAPTFSINNVSATEGGTLSFTVSKSGSTALSHNVSYATANGTALAGSDYTAKSGTLTFSSGQTSQTVTVATTQETIYEPNETLNMNLSSATAGATIADTQGTGTINNDDTPPNYPPVANNDSASMVTYDDLIIYVLNNDTDPDGDSLTITSVSNSSCVIQTSSRLFCLFTSTGTKYVTYAISDGNGGTDTASVTISVSNGGGGGGPFF